MHATTESLSIYNMQYMIASRTKYLRVLTCTNVLLRLGIFLSDDTKSFRQGWTLTAAFAHPLQNYNEIIFRH